MIIFVKQVDHSLLGNKVAFKSKNRFRDVTVTDLPAMCKAEFQNVSYQTPFRCGTLINSVLVRDPLPS